MVISAITFSLGKPPMIIRRVELRELRMRLLNPFETSFGVTQDRKVIMLKVSDHDRTGYGEVTAAEGPFYSHETYQTAWHVLSEYIIPRAIGQSLEHPSMFEKFTTGIRGHNMAKAGLETALWDLYAKIGGVPLW